MRTWFKKINLKERWEGLVILLSPLMFSVLFGFKQIKIFLGMGWFILVISIVTLITIYSWWSNVRSRTTLYESKEENLKLKDRNEHLEGVLQSLPEEFLKLLSKKWRMQGDTRITIYSYTIDDFIPLSRYSKNPDYDRKNRKSYPKDVGYISKCWAVEEGKYFKELPDPKKDIREYIDYTHKETGMLKKDIEKLPMKSRSYYGKTLHDNEGRAFLIIMIESTKPHIKNIKEISNDLEGTFSDFIISVVSSNFSPEGGSFYE